MRRSKTSAVLLGALVATAAVGGTIALESGCTVLTNDALPDDAGLFEAGDAAVEPCSVCLALQCRAPQALCLTNEACASVLTCGGDPDAGADAAAASRSACACSANADGGGSLERLYHTYTSCNDARLTACATECASQNRAPSTLPACSTPDDGGAFDAGDASADASSPDAGDLDGGAPDAEATDAEAPGPDACVACAAASCSGSVNACASGTECSMFLACSSACSTASCLADCAAQHPTGKVAATQLATCTASNCQKSCEL